MKFKCQKSVLLNEISNANDFTSQRNTITMLACVLISISENTMTVKATDQKMGYVSNVNVEGIQDGDVAVLCEKFLEIIRNLPEGEILINQEEDKISISTNEKKIEFKLRTINSSDFPEISILSENLFFKVPQRDFTDMIKQVSFAVSDDESKFAMNGALLEKEGNSLVMVATDGRRLSYINRKIENTINDFENITIPSRFLEIIKKHSTNEGVFELGITKQTIYVKIKNFIIFSSLIKNDFPAYKRVIPVNQLSYCIMNISDLESAIKRVALLAENKYKKIIIEFNNNTAKITTEESDIGVGKEEIPCSYEGEPFIFASNYTYLQNPIKVMDGSQVRISFSDKGKPFTVTSEPERDYKHIIMPMNLN